MVKRIGIGLAFVIPIAVLAVFETATWTPPVHEVHTRGAIALNANFLGTWPSNGRAPKPTTSLKQLRCEVLQTAGLPRPCAAGAVVRIWPAAVQQPDKLYVGLELGGGEPSSHPSGWNVEYNPSGRTLTIHDYESQPLLVLQAPDETPGAALQQSIGLLVISTDANSQGKVTVVADSRIEHLLEDQGNGTAVLGVVRL